MHFQKVAILSLDGASNLDDRQPHRNFGKTGSLEDKKSALSNYS